MLAGYRPVCQQSWSQELLLHRTRCFSHRSGWSHSQYSLLPIHGGTWVPRSVQRWFTRPKTVTHPGNNWAQCRVTMLIESKVLPLHHASTLTMIMAASNPLGELTALSQSPYKTHHHKLHPSSLAASPSWSLLHNHKILDVPLMLILISNIYNNDTSLTLVIIISFTVLSK